MEPPYQALGASWSPYDEAEKLEQTNLLTNTYVEALRALAPDSGAYINEVLLFLIFIIVSRLISHRPAQLILLTYYSVEGRSIRTELPTDFLGLKLSAPL